MLFLCLLPAYVYTAACNIPRSSHTCNVCEDNLSNAQSPESSDKKKTSVTTTLLEAPDETDYPEISAIMDKITEIDGSHHRPLQRSVSDSITLLLYGMAQDDRQVIQRSHSLLIENS